MNADNFRYFEKKIFSNVLTLCGRKIVIDGSHSTDVTWLGFSA